jgi:hypothetical protein
MLHYATQSYLYNTVLTMMKYPLQYIFRYKIPYTLQYVVPVAVNCSYCTADDGYGKYQKHVEWSCNKFKILVLCLVGHFVCVYMAPILQEFVNFQNMFRRSIQTSPGKALKKTFSNFTCLCGQHNFFSRATCSSRAACCPRTTGWSCLRFEATEGYRYNCIHFLLRSQI